MGTTDQDAQTPRDRSITVTGMLNLRDVAGLPTRDGGSVRRGVLYRGGSPAFLDAGAAAALVDDLGIAVRLDLRGSREAQAATSAQLLAVERSALLRTVSVPHSNIHKTRRPPTAWTDPTWVAQHYLLMAQSSAATIVSIARLLGTPGNVAALVHCSAGKDRTGVVVAIVLHAVGVRPSAITEDYAASNAEVPYLMERLKALPGYAQRLEAFPQEAFAAAPESMQGFLASLDQAHGGGRGFLEWHGMRPSELERLREALVE